VDDLGTIFLVFLLGDPLALEGFEGCKSRSTNPNGIVSISTSNNLGLVSLWAKLINILLNSVWETLVHGGATGEDNVFIEVTSDINIALLDRSIAHISHT